MSRTSLLVARKEKAAGASSARGWTSARTPAELTYRSIPPTVATQYEEGPDGLRRAKRPCRTAGLLSGSTHWSYILPEMENASKSVSVSTVKTNKDTQLRVVELDEQVQLPQRRSKFHYRTTNGFLPPVKIRGGNGDTPTASNRSSVTFLETPPATAGLRPTADEASPSDTHKLGGHRESVSSKSSKSSKNAVDSNPSGVQAFGWTRQYPHDSGGDGEHVRIDSNNLDKSPKPRHTTMDPALSPSYASYNSGKLNDLSGLPQTRVLVSRTSSWVNRYKTKRSMNELSKIFANKPTPFVEYHFLQRSHQHQPAGP